LYFYFVLLTGLAACIPVPYTAVPPIRSLPPSPTTLPTESSVLLNALSPLTPSPTTHFAVPDFTHIVVIFFENREFDSVIGNRSMPYYNQLASENTLLTQYYAVTHPSLPNYIAVFGGNTFGINSDCTKCFVQAPSLADQIEASGRTWRAYLEDMPHPCYVGNTITYAQKHDPFIYFDPIRLDAARCERSIVPLTQLDSDLAAGKLPDFVYIMPNLCNSGHNASTDPFCGLGVADHWLAGSVQKLLAYLQPRAATEPYLIVLTWDEGQTDHSCCGLPAKAGGRVPTVLISPLARNGFQDSTPYTHYSLLKTIEASWSMPFLGHAANPGNVIILAPWE
jgi:phospholipase C